MYFAAADRATGRIIFAETHLIDGVGREMGAGASEAYSKFSPSLVHARADVG